MDKITRLSRNEFNNLLRKAKRIGEASSESIIYDLRNGLILKDLMDESLLYFKSPEEMIYKEEDLLKIMEYNILSLPALVIDGKVISAGKRLSLSEVKELISK